MNKKESLYFLLGEAGMHATLIMTFVKEENKRRQVSEKLEIIVLDEAIKSREPIRANGSNLTTNIVGIKHFDKNVFELETNNSFYEIEFFG